MAQSQAVTITVDEARRVSGLLQVPRGARICYVLAHGAGAGMTHPFMADIAEGLAERGIATLRYQFPYMEQGSWSVFSSGPTRYALACVRIQAYR